MHRMIANEFVIDRHVSGQQIWPEFEVQRDIAPNLEIRVNGQNRIPDAITQADQSLAWIEVENAPKSRHRRAQLMTLATDLLSPAEGYYVAMPRLEGWFDEFIFVLANDACARATVRALRDAHLGPNVLQRIELIRVHMTPNLLWHGVVARSDAASLLHQLRGSRI